MAKEKVKQAATPQKHLVTSQQVIYTNPMEPPSSNMPISEFKAKCLGVVDDIATSVHMQSVGAFLVRGVRSVLSIVADDELMS